MGNFVLWLFILDPTDSPVKFLLSWLGYSSLEQVAEPAHLPVIIALMLFFQGAGTWILVIYGGLNGIPQDVTEAAIIDGCTPWQETRRIKLPLIRPWIAYFILINIAYASQLFLEPEVLGLATEGAVSPQWTPNQLSYTFCFPAIRRAGGGSVVGDIAPDQPVHRRHNYDPHGPVPERGVGEKLSVPDVLDRPAASGRGAAHNEAPRRQPGFRIREITPMGFLLLVAAIYLFIMVTFVLATLRTESSLIHQGAFGR